MESLLSWLPQYGYAALFGLLMLGIVGLPVPDETLLVFSGYLISTGKLRPEFTFAAAWGGSISGISLSYLLGRFAGQKLAVRYGRYIGFTPQRLEIVHKWFQKTGEWLLAFGYFVPGVRHFTALVAGMSSLEYRTFALFAYSGAAVWAAACLSLGYLVGENWQSALNVVHQYMLLSILVLVALAALAWWLRNKLWKRA